MVIQFAKTLRKSDYLSSGTNSSKQSLIRFFDQRTETVSQRKLQESIGARPFSSGSIQLQSIDTAECIQLRPNFGTSTKLDQERDKILFHLSRVLYGYDPIHGAEYDKDTHGTLKAHNLGRLHNLSWENIESHLKSGHTHDTLKAHFDGNVEEKAEQLRAMGHGHLAARYYTYWQDRFKNWGTASPAQKEQLLFEHPGNVYQIGPQPANSGVGAGFHPNFERPLWGDPPPTPVSRRNAPLALTVATLDGDTLDGQAHRHPPGLFAAPAATSTRDLKKTPDTGGTGYPSMFDRFVGAVNPFFGNPYQGSN